MLLASIYFLLEKKKKLKKKRKKNCSVNVEIDNSYFIKMKKSSYIVDTIIISCNWRWLYQQQNLVMCFEFFTK